MPARAAKRIVIVTGEILGLARTAGAATANTFLSFALADQGHRVEILYAAPIQPDGVAPEWRREYERREIAIRPVEPIPADVRPRTATVTFAVDRALQASPPDVVIADDFYGSCYVSVRLRRLGLSFPRTLFAVFCHGTTAWIADAHRKVRRWPASFEVEALERGMIECADAVVSPSAYMLDWMRDRGWHLRRAMVAPLLTCSAVDGATPASAPTAPIRRLAFFGRLEERKGLQPFIAALDAIDRSLLSRVDLYFVGKETAAWNVARIRAALSAPVVDTLAGVHFMTDLDQPDALALLREPGTLAVMPSLLDNSPMAIYECLEQGIPFLASTAGGGPELVAAEDRTRMFVEPNRDALSAALSAALASDKPIRPARAAFAKERTLAVWDSVLDIPPMQAARARASAAVDVLVIRHGSGAQLERCRSALSRQGHRPRQIVEGETLEDALSRASADFVLLVDDRDEPEPECIEAMTLAQATVDADVVTCSCIADGRVHAFLGEPRELGILANHYGLTALYRRSALEHASTSPITDDDADWQRLAALSQDTFRIESIPRALVRTARIPGDAARAPSAAFAVVRTFERAAPPHLRGLPTAAAGTAAL